ncbi:MAG: tRNA lysidine(34) synthetase TilS [Balneolaceae bacterium]|nr:tRNA lysidine(34) synthetase TilS [Balneolaceae bacterium]
MNKSESDSILKHLKKELQKRFQTSPFLIIGVSGGADSMALLYALHKLDVDGLVVHVNYGQRGKESDADQELVEQISAMWGFECCSIKPEEKIESGNFQEWAREQRYSVFEELRKVNNADAITVAHHFDDQLETILFKMLRGSGLPNLKGMQEWNDDRKIWRPLLKFSKQEILDYCENEHIPFRTDATNLESKYARNAIRNDVFSTFDEFIPGWKENLARITESASVFEESIAEVLKTCSDKQGIDVEAIADYSDLFKATLLKHFVEFNADVGLTKGQIEQLVVLLEAETGKFVELEPGIKVFKDRDKLTIKQEADAFNSKTIALKEVEAGVKFKAWKFSISDSKPESGLFVDATSLQWPLECRRWEPGDVFKPLGMSGTQKVSDHLTNRKIKTANRQDSLILCDSGGTICAILYPEPLNNGQVGNIAETNKETELTTRYFSIEKL